MTILASSSISSSGYRDWVSSHTSFVSGAAKPDSDLDAVRRSINAPIHAHSNNFDNLDKVFVIFRLPGKGRLHRRVDIIMAPKERYAAAVLSWSGSMMFERDFK